MLSSLHLYRSNIMSEHSGTSDTPRIRYERYCIICGIPATRECKACGLPLCEYHAKTGNNKCDACAEELRESDDYEYKPY